MSSSATAKQQLIEAMKAKAAAGEEKSLIRKIAESDLYDWNTTARALLTQIALLRMDEDSNYPEDAPDEFREDKVDWCWMSQHGLGLRIGASESTVHRLIQRFKPEQDGVIFYREWIDSNGCPHAEYKINEEVLDAHQRPSQKRGVVRPPRYKEKRGANNGSFSYANQPGKIRGIREEDDE